VLVLRPSMGEGEESEELSEEYKESGEESEESGEESEDTGDLGGEEPRGLFTESNICIKGVSDGQKLAYRGE
jgi:hypothetical protein